MEMHQTRGVEAPPTIKALQQEVNICERNLSRELAKVSETATSAEDSVIWDLIAKIKALTLNYAGKNKRLSHRKRETGCKAESNGLRKKLFSLVHHDSPEAVDLLNDQLVELGLETYSRLIIIIIIMTINRLFHHNGHTNTNIHTYFKSIRYKGKYIHN